MFVRKFECWDIWHLKILMILMSLALPVYSDWRVWVQGPGWPESFVSGCRGICFGIKFSGRHRRFDGVLFKLWPLANTWFRGTQTLVPAWTTDNRWRITACSYRPLMAMFACAAKLGSGRTAWGTLGLGRPSCSGY